MLDPVPWLHENEACDEGTLAKKPVLNEQAREIRTKKKFGQHFLHDRGLIDKILRLLDVQTGDFILEIGPGPGTLTFPLSEQSVAVFCVETDADMVDLLAAQPQTNLTVVHADFLKWDLPAMFPKTFKVLSNLPYNVSVPITARLLQWTDRIPCMVLMYQKEVANRVRAQPRTKDYGPISVLTQLFYTCGQHFEVAPGAFRPPPKVMSQVIRLDRRGEFLVPLEGLGWVDRITHRLFQQRRKMIGGMLNRLDWPEKSGLVESYVACGFSLQARPEDLSPNDYANWYRTFMESYEKR